MRSALNYILNFIGAASLTDEEFDGLTIESTEDDVATYEALNAVLVSRESVSSLTDKLTYYFLAKGAEIPTIDNGKSNILVGQVL